MSERRRSLGYMSPKKRSHLHFHSSLSEKYQVCFCKKRLRVHVSCFMSIGTFIGVFLSGGVFVSDFCRMVTPGPKQLPGKRRIWEPGGKATWSGWICLTETGAGRRCGKNSLQSLRGKISTKPKNYIISSIFNNSAFEKKLICALKNKLNSNSFIHSFLQRLRLIYMSLRLCPRPNRAPSPKK